MAGFVVDTGKVSRLGTVEYTLSLNEGGEQGSLVLSGWGRAPGQKGGERQCAKGANHKAQQGEPGSSESLRTVQREPAAARIDHAKHIERCRFEPAENRVQPTIRFNEAKKNHRLAPAWVKGEIAEDLYRGIHNEKIAATFFDARLLEPREQMAACVSAAVTSLVTARVSRLKVLSADEIERRVFEELLPGVATLELVKDFEVRRRHTVQAVTRTVISVCVRMLEKSRSQIPIAGE